MSRHRACGSQGQSPGLLTVTVLAGLPVSPNRPPSACEGRAGLSGGSMSRIVPMVGTFGLQLIGTHIARK